MKNHTNSKPAYIGFILVYLSQFSMMLFPGVSPNHARAQTQPQLNHYIFNYFLINPAVAGIEDYIDLKSSVRSQWNGLEGSPETLTLTVNGNIQSKQKINPANPQKPRIDPMNNYTIDLQGYNHRPHHGVGGYVLLDRVGPFTTSQVSGSFAYHIPLSAKYRLSAGVSLGFIHNRLDKDRITLHNPNDRAISGEAYNNVNPDLGVGMWFYSRHVFLGLSGGRLFKYNVGFGDTSPAEKDSYRNFVLTAGYKFVLSQHLMITPSVAAKSMAPNPLVVDYNVVFSFISRVSLAATLSSTNDMIIGARFIASPVFEFGYFFDYGGSSVQRYSQGSHELYLSIRLRNRQKILCPVII